MKLRLPSLRVAAVASSLLLAGGYVWFAHLGRIEQQRPKMFAGSKLRTLSIAGSRYSNPPPMTVKPVALGPFLNERAEPTGPKVSVTFPSAAVGGRNGPRAAGADFTACHTAC